MSETKVSEAEKKKKKPAPKKEETSREEDEHKGWYYNRPLWNRWSVAAEGMLLPSDHTDLLWRAGKRIPGHYHYMVAKGLERGLSGSEYGKPYDPREPRPAWSEGTGKYWAQGRYDFVPFKGEPRAPYGAFTPYFSVDKGMPPALRHFRKRNKMQEAEDEEAGFGIPPTPSVSLI